jgi:hypothetical protein
MLASAQRRKPSPAGPNEGGQSRRIAVRRIVVRHIVIAKASFHNMAAVRAAQGLPIPIGRPVRLSAARL